MEQKEFSTGKKDYSEFDEASPFMFYGAGVYGVFVRSYYLNNERCLYIGSSAKIQKRLMNPNHCYIKLLNRFKNCMVYTRIIETNNYILKEKILIKKYKPLLNIQHKGEK